METINISELLTHYSEQLTSSAYFIAPFILLTLYFMRNVIKNLVSSVSGYQSFIDDYSLAIHSNRDKIAQNQKTYYMQELNFKNAIYIVSTVAAALLSPLISAAMIIAYKIKTTKSKLKSIIDYSVYPVAKTDDKFINFLNQNLEKINLIVNEFLNVSYILIIIAFIFSNMTIAVVAAAAIAIVLTANIFIIYNIINYRLNFKQNAFYKMLRLVNASAFNNNHSLLILAIFSISSSYYLAGFSVYLWSLLILRAIIKITLKNLLSKEEKLEEIHKQITNREFDLPLITSYPNFKSQNRGYKFTTPLQLKLFSMTREKKAIYLNNYAFYSETIQKSDLRKNPLLRKKISEVESKINVKDFTMQMLVLGGMGSGKTAFINNIVSQVDFDTNFKNVTFNDKKGDFVQHFYRPEKDIIVNIYDERATAWCPFLEMKYNIEAGATFANNIFESVAGKEDDFFTGRAKQLVNEWFMSSYFNSKNNIEAWNLFFEEIEKYNENAIETDDKTAQSINQTVQIMTSMLRTMKYQIVDLKKPTFTLYEFVRTPDRQLFFLNRDNLKTKLTPYLNGIIATYITTIMAKSEEEAEGYYILNVFDEFLTMKIDEETRKTLLTATRDRGFCNILAAQYLNKDDKIIQDVDSSRYMLVTFNISDAFTLEQISTKFADAEHLQISSSEKDASQNETKIGEDGRASETLLASATGGILGSLTANQHSKSYANNEAKVILAQQLQSMPKYHHLTFIPTEEVLELDKYEEKQFFKLMMFGYENEMKNIINENEFVGKSTGILYLGITKYKEYPVKNPNFIQYDIKKETLLSVKNDKKSDVQEVEYSEKELFVHYMNVKFAETKEKATNYLVKNNIKNASKLFLKMEENAEKINMLLKKYSEEERYKIAEEFFSGDIDDYEHKYNVSKKYDLFGAILGIFTLSDEYIKNHNLKGDE